MTFDDLKVGDVYVGLRDRKGYRIRIVGLIQPVDGDHRGFARVEVLSVSDATMAHARGALSASIGTRHEELAREQLTELETPGGGWRMATRARETEWFVQWIKRGDLMLEVARG